MLPDLTTAAPPRPLGIPIRVWRILAVVVLVVGAWALAWSTGLVESFSIEGVRAQVQSWGALGIVGFILLACVANLLHVPGMVPIVAAILAFGEVTGSFVGWAGATAAAMTTFASMRMIGGRGITSVRNPLLRRLLTGLETRPMWTVALLRALFQNSPILNTTLALSPISTRGYLLGSAIGLWPPVLVAAFFTGWFV